MTSEDNFRIRPGPIRSRAAQRVRPFVHQAMAAAQKAGGAAGGARKASAKQGFGRGRAAAFQASRLLSNRSRQAVIKTRVVRHRGRPAALKAHLRYLQREGVTRDGDKALLFGPEKDAADGSAFAGKIAEDRHHFRFIVSPDDALQMEDLKAFTRDLMKQAEQDLGTRLDWVGVAHWNTEHPHVHIILRGKTDQGEDLVISRDYISQGMRARAQHLITCELGERSDLEIRQTLHRQVDADRLTQLDRQLLNDQQRFGFVDLAPPSGVTPDEIHVLKTGRMRKLESLGLASQFAPAQWVISDTAPEVLRELGERGDIIKRIHRGLAGAGVDRPAAGYVLTTDTAAGPVVGRLVEKGLDDELRGTAYAVIDATDGRVHHIRFASLEAAGDGGIGSVVEARASAAGQESAAHIMRVISDLPIEGQITAAGATWLDRTALTGTAEMVATAGFGAEVRDAIQRRGIHLVREGLAVAGEGGFDYSRDLLKTLRQRELTAAAADISARTGLAYIQPGPGDYASGTYRRRLDLASGRFAMLDEGAGFQLVPWSHRLQDRLGQHLSGVVRATGSVAWSFEHQRSLGR